MLWLIYAIVAIIIALIVAGTLIHGDISIARYAAKRHDSLLDSRLPGIWWLLGAVLAGVIIGGLWPIAVSAIGVSRYVQARADSAERHAAQPGPCSERQRSEEE